MKKTINELLQNILEAGVFNLTSSADWFKECMVWKIILENDSKAVLIINHFDENLTWLKSMAGTQAPWLLSCHRLSPFSQWYQLIVIIFGNIAHGLFSFPKLTWFTSFVWLIVADLQLNLERWHKKVERVWVLFPYDT